MNRIRIILLVFLPILISSKPLEPLKIGFFLGGRTLAIYRAFLYGYYEHEGEKVELITKGLRDENWRAMKKDSSDTGKEDIFGKATGDEIIQGMLKGKWQFGAVGETAFIKAAAQGLPVVAIAELGFDTKEKPGHAIAFRKGLNIKKPEDFKGKVFGSRRSSGGDTAFLLEFIEQMGLKKGDYTLKEYIMDDEWRPWFIEGKVDVIYFHLMALQKLYRSGHAEIYQRLTWANPNMSQAILVVHKDFLKKEKRRIVKMLKALVQRIRYENSLPLEIRRSNTKKGNRKMGYQMEKNFLGTMNLPQFRNKPTVRVKVLTEMAQLLKKHGFVSKVPKFTSSVDNSPLMTAMSEIKGIKPIKGKGEVLLKRPEKGERYYLNKKDQPK